MMTSAPEKMPATPMPAMARPTMSTVLEGATAQIKEPNSKTKTAKRNAHLAWEVSAQDAHKHQQGVEH